MKKAFTLVIMVLIASMLVMPVFAAESAAMNIAASKTTVASGDTIVVTVSLSDMKNCFSGGYLFSYNEEVFEYVADSGVALVKDFDLYGVSTINDHLAGYFMNTGKGTDLKGDIFQITLKVKDNAPAGEYEITGTPYLSVLNGENIEEVTCSTNKVTITIPGAETPDEPSEPSEPSEPETPVLLGDANLDGKVNLRDAILTLQAANGKDVNIDRTTADVTGDGKVNLQDAIRILKRANGNKDPFPAEK